MLDDTQRASSTPDIANWNLARFDLPSSTVKPLLWSLGQLNTIADCIFYDVGQLALRLSTRGIGLSTAAQEPEHGFAIAMEDHVCALNAATKIINLGALSNPEGAILVVDAHHAPFVKTYHDVEEFVGSGLRFPEVDEANPGQIVSKDIHTITITGVGSSAFGSAAFAWNISEALREPVAAIVPGYGLADIVPQALGGWFGFGVHDFLRRWGQQFLNQTSPNLAKVGHGLARTAPNAEKRAAGTAFRSGCPESDILHDILGHAAQIKRIYGHSKGALCIQNALRGLDRDRVGDLHVTTFGCAIQEEFDADYNQILGRIDGLGQLNSWGNWPEQWVQTWHSTNTMLPWTMTVGKLAKADIGDEVSQPIDPDALKESLVKALKEVLPTLGVGASGKPAQDRAAARV